MKNIINNIDLGDFVQNSPFIKTVISVFNLVLCGIVSGAFIAEITVGEELHWDYFYKTRSFYFILIFTFINYLYHKYLFSIDKAIDDFKDEEYVKAYMRRECLPELAKKANELIKKKKDIAEITEIIKKLKI